MFCMQAEHGTVMDDPRGNSTLGRKIVSIDSRFRLKWQYFENRRPLFRRGQNAKVLPIRCLLIELPNMVGGPACVVPEKIDGGTL